MISRFKHSLQALTSSIGSYPGLRTQHKLGVLAYFLSVFFACVFSEQIHAHGGVVSDEDICLIKVGFYQAHFTIYQPASTSHDQYCEDLPRAGESLFVLEYLHDGLEKLDVDFRIIQNTTGMGRFATWSDVQRVSDLAAITVHYTPVRQEPDVFTVLHQFDGQGEFIGIVTATHPETEKFYTAVFPFEVGANLFDYQSLAVTLVVVVFVLSIIVIIFRRRQKVNALVALFLAGGLLGHGDPALADEQTLGANGKHFYIAMTPSLDAVRINQMHTWRLFLTDQAKQPVVGARFMVSGGMLKHDHGLPTEPSVISLPEDGGYLMRGMKFHMSGAWNLRLQIQAGAIKDVIDVEFEL